MGGNHFLTSPSASQDTVCNEIGCRIQTLTLAYGWVVQKPDHRGRSCCWVWWCALSRFRTFCPTDSGRIRNDRFGKGPLLKQQEVYMESMVGSLDCVTDWATSTTLCNFLQSWAKWFLNRAVMQPCTVSVEHTNDWPKRLLLIFIVMYKNILRIMGSGSAGRAGNSYTITLRTIFCTFVPFSSLYLLCSCCIYVYRSTIPNFRHPRLRNLAVVSVLPDQQRSLLSFNSHQSDIQQSQFS